MGGDITVKSQFGKGTSFYISVKVGIKILKEELSKFSQEEKIQDRNDLDYKNHSAQVFEESR